MESIYVQAFDNASEYLKLDTLRAPSKDEKVRITGWFQYVGNKLSALYFKNDTFFVQYDNQCLKIEEGTVAKITKNNDEYEFSLYQKDHLALTFTYIVSNQAVDPNFDLTPFVEEEDFNWGVFMFNIINNKSRMLNIIEHYKEKK
jgi:hypothetical protein